MIPPVVTTVSPRLAACTSSRCSFARRCCGPPQYEIDDRDHRDNRHELDDCVVHAQRPGAGGLGISFGYKHRTGAPATRRPRRFIKGSHEKRRIYSRAPCESNARRPGFSQSRQGGAAIEGTATNRLRVDEGQTCHEPRRLAAYLEGMTMNKQLAEFIGTFALVFFGCGAAVIGGMGTGATAVDLLGISSAFGFALIAMAYGIGPVSGCHINPAVSFGVFVAGRMSVAEMIGYWIAQVLGALVAAGILYIILSGKANGWNGGLGQNGWGPGYLGEYNLAAAFVFEVVATFLFLVTILGVTHPFTPAGFAGLAIGLTLAVIHLVGINITGTSVNPARSIGPGDRRLCDEPEGRCPTLAVHCRPLIGAGAAGLLFREGALLVPPSRP